MTAFSWSQHTYGGSTACTAISAFGAASFADGFAPSDVEERLRLLTQAGCALWSRQHRRSQSVQEILDVEPFFSSSYESTSWQCGPKEYQMTLTALLAEPEFKSLHWGAVVTDGVSSVSIGRNGGTYCEFRNLCRFFRFFFDTHPSFVRQPRGAVRGGGLAGEAGSGDLGELRGHDGRDALQTNSANSPSLTQTAAVSCGQQSHLARRQGARRQAMAVEMERSAEPKAIKAMMPMTM